MPKIPGVEVLYDVPRVQQQMSNWCWAACLEMVGKFYGDDNATQGLCVSFVRRNYGDDGNPNIMGSAIEVAGCGKKVLGLNEIDWKGDGNIGNSKWPVVLPPKALMYDLNAGRLMIVGYQEHARVVVGYKVVNEVLHLYLNDPADGALKLVSYDAVKASFQYRVTFAAWTQRWAEIAIANDPGLS